MLERFVCGLNGRPLKVAPGEHDDTDTETIFLPHVVGRMPEKEDNFRLYKAMTVHQWAQNWCGTWAGRGPARGLVLRARSGARARSAARPRARRPGLLSPNAAQVRRARRIAAAHLRGPARGGDRILKRQSYGEDVDIDALVEAYAGVHVGLEMSDRLFTRLPAKVSEIYGKLTS